MGQEIVRLGMHVFLRLREGNHCERREARGNYGSANLQMSFPQGFTSLEEGGMLVVEAWT